MLVASLILVPLIGGGAAWIAGRRSAAAGRWVAMASALLTALLACVATGLSSERGAAGLLNAAATAMGDPSLLALRLDGLSAPLVVLTAMLGVVAVLASWRIDESAGEFFGLLLALQAAVTAVFLADDIVLFYVAWEAVLIPMYFLIGRWGHERRKHAAMKFFVYTFAGSALMLIGLVLLVVATGGRTRITLVLSALDVVPAVPGIGSAGVLRAVIFWLLAAGFAVKVPIWPLHTWLPDAHVEAPTAGSIMLAGVLLKMGGYGFLRLGLPVSPEAAKAAAPLLAALGMVGIVYGALMAFAQTDLKRLVAYSSVAHMGFFVLAIAVATPAALAAAMLVMVSHGVVAALLFLLVGSLYERTHTRDLDRLGGLLAVIPGWGTALVFASLAGLGLPGLAGFPGELAAFLEGFRAYGWWMAVVAAGIVLAGAYALRAVRAAVQGPVPPEWHGLHDLDAHEALAIAPLALATLVVGVWPGLVVSMGTPLFAALSTLLGRG